MYLFPISPPTVNTINFNSAPSPISFNIKMRSFQYHYYQLEQTKCEKVPLIGQLLTSHLEPE